MSDTTIHNIHVSYDESHVEVKDFVNYLKSQNRKDEMKTYYDEAFYHNVDKIIYINDKLGNEFILECLSEHKCALKLRGM